MAKAFKKNDLVTLIVDWDRKGTVTYRDAVVYSCGMKQMVLTDAKTGEEIGRHFAPVNMTNADKVAPGTYRRLTREEAEAVCLEIGANTVADERARMEHCIKHYGYGEDHGYTKAMRKDIAALHEPIAMSHEEAMEIIRGKIAAKKTA